jgi:hypothetical protein
MALMLHFCCTLEVKCLSKAWFPEWHYGDKTEPKALGLSKRSLGQWRHAVKVDCGSPTSFSQPFASWLQGEQFAAHLLLSIAVQHYGPKVMAPPHLEMEPPKLRDKTTFFSL